jgi:hypothetical protein
MPGEPAAEDEHVGRLAHDLQFHARIKPMLGFCS